MPTATEFSLAARIFDNVTDDLGGLVGMCRPYLGPEVVQGGLLGQLVADTLDVTDQNLAHASIVFTTLAGECRRREAVCRSYAASMSTYYTAAGEWSELDESLPDGDIRPRHPRRPQAPPGWVEI